MEGETIDFGNQYSNENCANLLFTGLCYDYFFKMWLNHFWKVCGLSSFISFDFSYVHNVTGCKGEDEVAVFSAKHWDRKSREDLLESATSCHNAQVAELNLRHSSFLFRVWSALVTSAFTSALARENVTPSFAMKMK